MKKLALAAAIASSLSVSSAYVEAKAYHISTSIIGSQMILGVDMQTSHSLVFGGSINIDTAGGAGDDWTVSANQHDNRATLTGSQYLDVNSSTSLELIYDITGTSHANGILFDDGNIDLPVDGVPYSTIDVSFENVSFESTSTWNGLPVGGIDMSGGTVNGDGTITIVFNGLWTGTQPLEFADYPPALALTSGLVTLFGNTGFIFLEGEITLTEAPIPAGAWLFGSALIGLAGIKRKSSPRTQSPDGV